MYMLIEEVIVVPTTPQQLDAIHAALDRFWATVATTVSRSPDGGWRTRFATAVAEISANIIRHAYPDPREPGPMRLHLYAYPDRIEAYFSDEGVAFMSPLPVEDGPETDPLELPESGRGLAVAQACLDELGYRRTGEGTNEWRLVKRLPG
jgi:serine/threonine-protein kinase RsbW